MGQRFGALAIIVLLALALALAWGIRAAVTVVATAYTEEVPVPTRVVVRGPTQPSYYAATAPAYPVTPGKPR